MTKQFPTPDALAYSIDEACEVSGIGRSLLYEFIRAGDLPIVKIRTRTLIRRAALDEFLRGLERVTPPKAAA